LLSPLFTTTFLALGPPVAFLIEVLVVDAPLESPPDPPILLVDLAFGPFLAGFLLSSAFNWESVYD